MSLPRATGMAQLCCHEWSWAGGVWVGLCQHQHPVSAWRLAGHRSITNHPGDPSKVRGDKGNERNVSSSPWIEKSFVVYVRDLPARPAAVGSAHLPAPATAAAAATNNTCAHCCCQYQLPSSCLHLPPACLQTFLCNTVLPFYLVMLFSLSSHEAQCLQPLSTCSLYMTYALPAQHQTLKHA